MSKKLGNVCSDGYFEFWAKNQQKGVKICNSDADLFLFWSISFQLMADQVIFDIGWVVDKAYTYTMKGQW